MMVSPGMSLAAAGVASGICFLIFASIRRGKAADSKQNAKEILLEENRCACCLKPFFVGRGVRCNDCGARSCRKGCTRWDTTDNAWHCLFCRQQRFWLSKNGLQTSGGPLEEQDLHRYFDTAKSRVYVAGVENAAASSGVASAGEKDTMETVRDFVEKLVVGLIGNVDDTAINRLYDHPAYAPSEDSPAMAHTALREIVERAVEEAKKLPSLGGSPSETGKPQERKNITDHSYEDLLATAILNKVIEKFQKEQVDGNSNVLREKPVSASKCALSENETGFDEGVEEGCSSLEPLSQDECGSVCSAFCPRHLRNEPESLSLTIEERIEEVTTTYASDEDPRDNSLLAIRNAHRVPFPELGMDIIDPSQESSDDSQDEPDTPTPRIGLVSPVESWEENWLFQKKRIQSQADPVAMLVPNPSADFKALIGDKDAEDTSDLSECSSAQSDEEIEKELMEAIHNVVPRSPRGRELENGVDSCYEKSNGISMKKICVETLPSDVMIERKTGDLEKTDSRVPIDGSIEKIERKGAVENDEIFVEVEGEYLARKVQVNEVDEVDEAKEVRSSIVQNLKKDEESSEKVITEREKAAPDNELKIEAEEEIADEESKEDGAENAANANDSTNVLRAEERAEPAENNSSDSNDSMRLPMVFSQEETVSDVPKTPTCTPTRTSETDVCTESENDAEIRSSKEERVLNSLECAKKKLMAVDEDTADASKEEDKSDRRRIDLHAEDIQQESEYTEHYDMATQRHLDSLTKTDVTVLENGATDSNMTEESKCREAVALAKAESASQLSLQSRNSEEEIQLATPPRPGTIAEREHKKWENAPPIENNPYSEENIQKRLWERQYSRRSSDIPGIHTELPKSNGADLEVVLTSQERDIKRFGRDYYINDSRASSNEKGRRSTASTCSRPSSSLSQRSSSASADQEQQEETQYKETEFLLNRSNDVKSKVARWQRNNNLDSKYQSPVRSRESSIELERCRNDSQKAWEDQRMEEILENERKNSKNEMNAKLNNQENFDAIEAKKSYSDDGQRKIKRIDLKAYGFENEFSLNSNGTKTSAPRMVNKLDLKSFGYDGGIRRTQSNIHLNSTVNDHEFKPGHLRAMNKSNLTRHRDLENDHDVIETQASGDNMTQSTEALLKFENEAYNGFGLKSAISVPNIARSYSNASSNLEDEEVDGYSRSSYSEFRAVKNGSADNATNNYNIEECNIRSDSSVDESGSEMDNSCEGEQTMSNGEKKISNDSDFDRKMLPMPSVRRLAEAFSKQSEPATALASKAIKINNVYKERSSTPEIQIVETPRQMHSLTARSLSKQFREGLRQIPSKVASPPASHVTVEQTKIPGNQAEVVQTKNDNVTNDKNVILPGKLKSNIIFWEQMQRKS